MREGFGKKNVDVKKDMELNERRERRDRGMNEEREGDGKKEKRDMENQKL